jgi:hypothetical protein
MPKERTFHIVWVGRDHGAGEALTSQLDKTVQYSGAMVVVKR